MAIQSRSRARVEVSLGAFDTRRLEVVVSSSSRQGLTRAEGRVRRHFPGQAANFVGPFGHGSDGVDGVRASGDEFVRAGTTEYMSLGFIIDIRDVISDLRLSRRSGVRSLMMREESGVRERSWVALGNSKVDHLHHRFSVVMVTATFGGLDVAGE